MSEDLLKLAQKIKNQEAETGEFKEFFKKINSELNDILNLLKEAERNEH